MDGAVKKFWIGAHVLQKFFRCAVIGQVAAALAGDEDFARGTLPGFDDGNIQTMPRGKARAKQAGGSAADNYGAAGQLLCLPEKSVFS